MTNLRSYKNVIQHISENNPAGFTVDKVLLEPITTGYAIAVSETQDSFGDSGLDKVIEIAKHNWIDAIGGWLNSDNGKYYYDAVMVVDDINDALLLASRNKQIAIFDLSKGEEIRLYKDNV